MHLFRAMLRRFALKVSHLELRNPFHTYEDEAEAFTESLNW